MSATDTVLRKNSLKQTSKTRHRIFGNDQKNGAKFINIEIVCSDKAEHRNQIEERTNDIENLKLPTCDEVKNREYHRWESDLIVIDTARKRVEESIKELVAKINTTEKQMFRYSVPCI